MDKNTHGKIRMSCLNKMFIIILRFCHGHHSLKNARSTTKNWKQSKQQTNSTILIAHNSLNLYNKHMYLRDGYIYVQIEANRKIILILILNDFPDMRKKKLIMS